MGRKKCFGQHVSSSPATAPPTAPPSSRSEPATPFSPSSFYCKGVVLSEWWLIKSGADVDGKRLAVGGFTQRGHASRVFNSAPIVKRYDAFTVETADGITVRFQGFIDKSRTHNNGFPPEVSRCFLFGFPFNWDCYADGDFTNKGTPPTMPTCASGADDQLVHSSDGVGSRFPIHLGAFLDLLRSSHNTLVGDNSNVDFTCAPQNPNGTNAVSTTLRDQLDVHLSIANTSLRGETLVRDEVDKKNQNHENNARFADGIGYDSGRNASGHAAEASCLGKRSLRSGSQGEILEVDNRVIMSNDNPSTVKKNNEGQQEMSQGMQNETFLQKGAEFEKDNESPKHQSNLQFCTTPTSTSSDGINKKGVDHSEYTMSLQKTSINEPCKTSILLSVNDAPHSGDSVVPRSEKAGDVTGKIVLEIPNHQDGDLTEALLEAHHGKEKTPNANKRKKTPNANKRKTIWGPSPTLESPLTRHKARKLAVTSPELLDLKRSKSGRLLVPRIERGRQTIIYAMDRTITGISGVDVVESPCKGSKSKLQKKRKLH